jgi:hypothetical protein
MSGELSEIFKIFKHLFLILIIVLIISFSFFTLKYSGYDMNIFEININGTPMNCFYSEKYNSAFLVQAQTSSLNDVDPAINSIELEDTMNLEIDEYEVYYKSGRRKEDTTGWHRDDGLNYVKVDNDVKIEIKRMNKVLYDGKYINDLSKYINEKGRYYIHVYSTRSAGLFTSVKTHISFNVIVGGGNYE